MDIKGILTCTFSFLFEHHFYFSSLVPLTFATSIGVTERPAQYQDRCVQMNGWMN